MSQYLVWSNEHVAWWAPGHNGYVKRIEDAGRYSRHDALNICAHAMPGRRGDEPLRELPVRLDDLEVMLLRWVESYPGHDAEPQP